MGSKPHLHSIRCTATRAGRTYFAGWGWSRERSAALFKRARPPTRHARQDRHPRTSAGDPYGRTAILGPRRRLMRPHGRIGISILASAYFAFCLPLLLTAQSAQPAQTLRV